MKRKTLSRAEVLSPRSRHCSLGDLRSWTDIVTNVTSLSSVRLEQDLHALLELGTAPNHLLPGFVHEATHHWCFLSPVGFTLSYLQLRARRNGVLLYNGKGDAKTLEQLLGDVVRYETALALLRPLAEGLALFMEFDALSGPDSSVFSTPTELVGWLFSGGIEGIRYGGIHLPLEGTRRPLVEWRQTDQCLRRKEAMFGHPFEVSSGGYLPGYLAVRQLWFQLAFQDHRLLNESDLFLMFVRSFFYDDYELIALLLDEEPVEFATSESIISHIAGRFDELGRASSAQVAQFEQAVAAKAWRQGEELGCLSDTVVTDRDDAERGHRMARDLLEQLETPDLESVEGLLTLWDSQILGQRDIINFGRLDVQVAIDESAQCRISVDEKTIHIGSCLSGVSAGSASGSLNLLCSALMATKARAVTVHRGEELVAVFFGGPDKQNEQMRHCFMKLGKLDAFQSGTEEMRGYMDSVLAWDGVAEIVAEMRSMLPEVSEAVYSTKAFPGVSEMQRASVVSAMRVDGLLPILNWDRLLVNGVALLSLSWSLRLRRPQIVELLSSHGMGLEPTLEAVEACSKKYGIPKIWDRGDVLLCSV